MAHTFHLPDRSRLATPSATTASPSWTARMHFISPRAVLLNSSTATMPTISIFNPRRPPISKVATRGSSS